MSSYREGKIYTIRCKTDVSVVYVGSTIQSLHQRWAGHKRHSVEKNHQNMTLYKWIDGNFDDWYIELYENYPCDCREELHKREGQVIREIGNINQRIAGRNPKTYYEENRDKERERKAKWRQENPDKTKDYYNENKDKIIQNVKEWYVNNKEYRKEYSKNWRNNNTDILKEKQKTYYQQKKADIKQIVCECGGHYLNTSGPRHFKTKLHQNWEQQQS